MGIQKDKSIIFNWDDLQNGVGDSPYTGLSVLRNVNIVDTPGVAKIANASSLKFSTTSLPVAIIQDIYGSTYVGCQNGEFYINGVKNAHSFVNIWDMKIYNNYLFIAHQDTISVYGPLFNSPQIFSGWLTNGSVTGGTTLSAGYQHTLVVGRDNIVYVANGNTVGALSNFTTGTSKATGPGTITVVALNSVVNGSSTTFTSTFKVGSKIYANGETHTVTMIQNDSVMYTDNWVANFSGTYQFDSSFGASPTASFNSIALQLPNGVYARSMCEYGTYLVVGTQQGSSAYDFQYGFGNLYYWDRTSPTFDGQPQIFYESGIHQIIQVNGNLYIHAGIYGDVYQTNRSSLTLIRQLPYNYLHQATLFPYLNAIQKMGNELVIGTSTLTDTFPSKSHHGVWSMPLPLSGYQTQFLNGTVYLKNTPSTGNHGANQALQIGAICATNSASSSGVYKYMLFGWSDGTNYGVDEIVANLYSNSSSVIETPLYSVGSPTNRITYNKVEYTLGQPLNAGESLSLYYRKSLSDTYVQIGTAFTTANTPSGEVSMSIPPNMLSVETVQFKIIPNSTNSIAQSNVYFKELRVLF